MHALNNLLGGPYVTQDACRRAASRVATDLSEAGVGDAEDSAHHLDPATGWLSIDVINVVGAGSLGSLAGHPWFCFLADLAKKISIRISSIPALSHIC